MNTGQSPPGHDAGQEISALIETLHASEKRLEELTAGEVDTVTDRQGRTIVLRRAQDQLRQAEAARQAAILNALPTHIALLDTSGVILSVNRAWRQFATANALHSPAHAVGVNYLEVCDNARGEYSVEAAQVAAGIRAVLLRKAGSFSIRYSCHSPTQERWFLLLVAPLGDARPGGAVVMHLDITAQRQSEENLRISELRFRQMADNISDVFFLRDADGNRMLYISPAYERIWGRSCESLYAHPESWIEAIHPDDRKSIQEKSGKGDLSGHFSLEFRIVRPDQSIRWIASEGFPVHDGAGNIVRIAGIARDITDSKQAAGDLRESDRRFSNLLQNVQLASVMLDREARITYCNEYLLRLTGWRSEEVMGRNWFDVFMPPELGDMKPVFEALLANLPEAWHVENEIFTRSRERRLIRWNNSVLRSSTGDVVGVASIGEDITERKKADDRIAYLNRVYAVLSGINMLIVRVRNRDELFGEACRIAVETGGFRIAWIGVLDRSSARLVPFAAEGMDKEYLAEMKLRFSTSAEAAIGNTLTAQALRERRPIVANDSENDPRIVFRKKHTEAGVRAIAFLPLIVADEAFGVLALYAGEIEFFHEEELKLLTKLTGDISFAIDHIGKRERLRYLAYYDVLTGLPNRALFHERLEQNVTIAREQGRKGALILLDIERFKAINDTLGRPAGDALLRELAARLSAHAADTTRLARIDADHFAVMVPEVHAEEDLARLIEQRVSEVFGPPFLAGDSELRVTARFGIAMFPADGADADTLFRNAETALKNAKLSGDRYLFYTHAMNARIAGKLNLENQLRMALEKSEFVLHYQPKVNLASGRLTGAEALIRWHDPRSGLVPPAQFIPILEETGLINEVGRWALRQAISDYLRWRTAGLPAVRIAVNVSPLQLRGQGFITEIEDALCVDMHAAAGLELEITESLIMADVQLSIASLKKIRTLGVTIAIDDFGTGFSSLSYLAKLPVDTLKIDRSFVIDMTASQEGLALVSTIINLAHSLKLKVVAEGVETEEQRRLLQLLGCDEMQGYLFSKPLPSEIFEQRYLQALPAQSS